MLIRTAKLEDLPGIFAIYDAEVLSGTATFETTPKTPGQREEWFQAHAPDRYPLMVADDDGDILGWAGISQWSPRQAYDRSAESSVYVHPRHQHKGLGRGLMIELMHRAKACNRAVLVARIAGDNPASVKLHELLGFETIGVMRRIGEKFGKVLDVRVMMRHLDEAGPPVPPRKALPPPV